MTELSTHVEDLQFQHEQEMQHRLQVAITQIVWPIPSKHSTIMCILYLEFETVVFQDCESQWKEKLRVMELKLKAELNLRTTSAEELKR